VQFVKDHNMPVVDSVGQINHQIMLNQQAAAKNREPSQSLTKSTITRMNQFKQAKRVENSQSLPTIESGILNQRQKQFIAKHQGSYMTKKPRSPRTAKFGRNKNLQNNIREIEQIVDNQMAKLNSEEDEYLPTVDYLSNITSNDMAINFYQRPFSAK
jgi:hypothetical protein